MSPEEVVCEAILKQYPKKTKNGLREMRFLITWSGSTSAVEVRRLLERNFSDLGRGLFVDEIEPVDGNQGAWIVTLAKGFKRSVFILEVLSSGGKLIESIDPFDKSKGCFEVSLLEQ